jgi:chorismate dehydratase
MRVGRVPYVNCYPVYGAIDRGIVPLDATIATGVPSALNAMTAAGELDVSVVSAVEYAQNATRYLLLPDLAITSDGPVRSVLLLSHRPAAELGAARVLLSRSSMTSVALLKMLFEQVWGVAPEYGAADAELTDLGALEREPADARLVIGDAALQLGAMHRYPFVYDLGAEWKRWTGLPFVFAVWVAQRSVAVADALRVHARLSESRDWGLAHLDLLAEQAAARTGVSRRLCAEYLSGLDYRLSDAHVAGLTDFFRRLAHAGRVPSGSLAFLPAA